jgi:colanic acid/amylovoran biosynthesis glycosyltransferase
MGTDFMRYESRQRVLIFRTDLLPISETFILAQAKALRRFEPRFVGLRRARPSLEIPESVITAADGDGLGPQCARRLYKLAGLGPRFHKRVGDLRAQLIHAHFGIDGVLALPLARAVKLPLIVTLHGYDATISDAEFAKTRTGRLYLNRRRDLWRHAAAILCVSDFIRAKALEAGFPEAKLRQQYIGVDPTRFRRTEQTGSVPSVLFVGRLVEKKGCDVLIRAMQIVQQQIPSVQTNIVGDGPLRSPLETLAKSLQVNCTFLGSCPSERIKQLLERSSLLCLPSRTASNGDTEGLPMVILEAQAMGVPVVSSLHAGIPEAVIHGLTGMLAPEEDYETLAEYLTLLLARDDLRLLFGSRAATFVRDKFNLEIHTRALEDIYEEVTSMRCVQ